MKSLPIKRKYWYESVKNNNNNNKNLDILFLLLCHFSVFILFTWTLLILLFSGIYFCLLHHLVKFCIFFCLNKTLNCIHCATCVLSEVQPHVSLLVPAQLQKWKSFNKQNWFHFIWIVHRVFVTSNNLPVDIQQCNCFDSTQWTISLIFAEHSENIKNQIKKTFWKYSSNIQSIYECLKNNYNRYYQQLICCWNVINTLWTICRRNIKIECNCKICSL